MLDLGEQPAADHFPRRGDPGPDPTYPLRMVFCVRCALAQLEDDRTDAEEPRGLEPAALVDQAIHAVADLAAAGLAPAGSRVVEFDSPHGGSWLGPLTARGLKAKGEAPVDLVVDSLGLMHEADLAGAFAARVALLAPDGVLALHVHTLATILRDGTWNALRHGHYAYLSLPVLLAMARQHALVPVGLWDYPLYGGTIMVAFAYEDSATVRTRTEGRAWAEERSRLETRAGVTDAEVVAGLAASVHHSGRALRSYLDGVGHLRVAGYGAASRAVALLVEAGITAADVMAVADAAPGKHGCALPGSRIPIVSPEQLLELHPDRVLLFVPDLLPEVRAALPSVEISGGRWVLVESEPREIER